MGIADRNLPRKGNAVNITMNQETLVHILLIAPIPKLLISNINLCIHTATACDGRFLLTGNSGSFQADRYPRPGGSGVACRWIIR